LKALRKFSVLLDWVVSKAGRRKELGRVVILPALLNVKKKDGPTVVILLVSKLPSGRAVRFPQLLKLLKKLSPTVVMLLVSKLQLGRVMREALELKRRKKFVPTTPLMLLMLKLPSGRLVREP